MEPKKSLYYLEFQKLNCRRNQVIIVILFAILLLTVQLDINEDKKKLKELKITNTLEKIKVEQFDRYVPYSVYGIRLFTLPNSLNFLSNLKIYNILIAAVDAGTKLSIYESRKGDNILPDPSSGYLNFTGLLLIFGSLFSMLLGFEAFNEKHLRFLCSLKSYATVIAILLISRMIYISTILGILALCLILLTLLNGLTVSFQYFFVFVGLSILVMMFFLFLGAFSRSLKTRKRRIIVLVGLYFVINFFSLLLIVKIVKGFSQNISEPLTEYEKVKILMAFERVGIKKFNDLRSGEAVNIFMESYLENQLKILEDIESKHKKEIFAMINIFKALSVFFPSTFYSQTVNEISGGGYNNYFDFYEFTEKKKSDFIKFFFEKEYFSKTKTDKVESFIKENENIFQCRPGLPENFWSGIFLILFYSTGSILLTYQLTYKKIFPINEQLENEEDVYTVIRKGEPNAFFTNSELLKAKLCNHFSGQEKLKGDLDFYPDDELANQGKIYFLYLGPTSTFKHVSPATLHAFFFGTKPEKNMETWEVLLKYALTFQLVIFDEFIESIDPRKLTDTKKQLQEQGIYSLVITANFYFALEFIEDPRNLKYQVNDPIGKYLETQLKKRNQ